MVGNTYVLIISENKLILTFCLSSKMLWIIMHHYQEAMMGGFQQGKAG